MKLCAGMMPRGELRPECKVGNLPLLLGFSIQPELLERLICSLELTKPLCCLENKLHISYARAVKAGWKSHLAVLLRVQDLDTLITL